jgi:hypothetical protein
MIFHRILIPLSRVRERLPISDDDEIQTRNHQRDIVTASFTEEGIERKRGVTAVSIQNETVMV